MNANDRGHPWRWGVAGALSACVYFERLFGFPLHERVRGDAASYLAIGTQLPENELFPSFETSQGVGLPLLLRAFRAYLEPLAADFGRHWFEWVPVYLFLFHLACCALFWEAARRTLSRSELPTPHPLLLFLLLLHPGLVAGTTLLLTDTLTVDLVLLGSAAWLLRPADGQGRPLVLAAAGSATGLCWALAAIARPVFVVPVLGAATLLVLVWGIEAMRARAETLGARAWVRRGTALTALLVSVGTPLLLAVERCEQRHGEACLADPVAVRKLSGWEGGVGLSNVRTYWSSKTTPPGLIVLVTDRWIRRHLSDDCVIERVVGPKSSASCVLSHLHLAPVLAFKKAAAFVDQQHYQSYVADGTPARARHYFRLFSALTWLGLLGMPLAIVAALRRAKVSPRFRESLAVLTLPLLAAAAHVLGHVESRYLLVLVPFGYVALGCVLAVTLARAARRDWRFVAFVAGAATLALGAWFAQLGDWDSLDSTQQLIDAGFSGGRG
ncbi:MAG TPA: hypothetical protein VMS65_11060 [Polyangiaceae bacterium]|nr:hypothetical protein [Polyangiaceae bacterium]